MIAAKIAGATGALLPPEGWEEGRHGKCSQLWVRLDGGIFQSAWEPTPGELALLNAGGKVILSVVGHQPPVALGVELASEDD